MLKTTILIPAYQPNENMVTIVKQLSEIGYTHILIVNDGSDESTHGYFLRAEMYGATLLHHSRNLGKGAALRTGIRYATEHFPNDIGIVTADADGQHLPVDIHRVAQALEHHTDHLILGVRKFTGEDVPWKSRFGNNITAFFFRLSTGMKVSDTQTGLRGIPKSLYDLALSTEGNRYEYEMHMLEDAVKEAPIFQLPITTVYENGNKSSHFRPVKDSIRVYARPLKFVTSSLSSSIVDLLLFWILLQFLPLETAVAITTATVIARIVSSILNFSLNQFWCFRSKEKVTHSGLRYILLLVVQMGMSAGLVTLISTVFASTLAAKIIVDVSLSVVSYYVQKHWVFKKKEGNHGKQQQTAGTVL